MAVRDLVFLGTVVVGAAAFLGGSLRPIRPDPIPTTVTEGEPPSPADRTSTDVVERVDTAFHASWVEAGLTPAPPASDLQLLRRLSLALMGTIPSLEEIRRFEALPTDRRVGIWLDEALRDPRTANYLSERLARAYVGTEDGQFILFRRRRFTTWLAESIHENRPYDAIVRDLIAEDGLWTDHPATNFITGGYSQETERPDPERLAVRASRAFLGIRMECAQCHDHPFADWKQDDFRGLAAFFGATHSDLRGIRDTEPDYRPIDPATNEPIANPQPMAVPFQPEALPAEGSPRERLAAWLVNAENPHLALATVNRVWALMFGRPLSDPVDDLPAVDQLPEPLTLLADDFRTHGYDLRRLITTIARTQAFRLDSAMSEGEGPTARHEALWASFPLSPVRPEQVAGAVHQVASLPTIGPESPWLIRLATYTGRSDFVRRYGDTGEDEFDAPGGTIPQRLLLMNGDLVREKTKPDLFSASTLIAQLAPDDAQAVEVAYLTLMTRRPSPEEADHFMEKLKGSTGDERARRLSDLFWTLLNSTEFSWNH